MVCRAGDFMTMVVLLLGIVITLIKGPKCWTAAFLKSWISVCRFTYDPSVSSNDSWISEETKLWSFWQNRAICFWTFQDFHSFNHFIWNLVLQHATQVPLRQVISLGGHHWTIPVTQVLLLSLWKREYSILQSCRPIFRLIFIFEIWQSVS